MKPLERELAVMRELAACRGDDASLDEACAELAELRKVEREAAMLREQLFCARNAITELIDAFHLTMGVGCLPLAIVRAIALSRGIDPLLEGKALGLLSERQEPLGAEFCAVWDDNVDTLYES